MILKLALLLCLLALASPQDHDDSQQPELDLEQLQRQEASMKRTACLILSRYHSNAHKEVIEEIVSTLQGEDQSKYINKMYAMAVERCLPSISVDEAQMFFSEQGNFDPSALFYLLDGFDYPQAAHDVNSLSPNQKNIIKFIKQFDEEMQVRREEREATQEQTDGYERDEVLSIFGIDIDSFGTTAGIIYLGVFGSIVAVALWWGFSHLNNSTVPKKKTHKQLKKEKKAK